MDSDWERNLAGRLVGQCGAVLGRQYGEITRKIPVVALRYFLQEEDSMKDKVIEQSQKFWQSLEKADSKANARSP